MASEDKLQVGYWAIRGLAAPLRMICVYAGAEFESNQYEVINGDRGQWFSKKPALKEKNAFMNLPYVKDGDNIVTQSNACLSYLGRKFKLNGDNDQELTKVEQAICQAFDLRNDAVRLFYSPKEAFAANIDGFLQNSVNAHYEKFNLWLEQQGTKFLVKNEPTVPDFHLAELIDQIETLATRENKTSPLEAFPKLKAYFHDFQNLPQIQKYLASDFHKLPINNPSASFR